MRTNQMVSVHKGLKGMKGMTVIRVEMGVFDTWVRILIGPEKNIQAYVRWSDNNPDFLYRGTEYGPKGLCLKSSGYSPIVWIPRRPRTPAEYGTLTHECLHAVFHLMDWLGMTASQETSEVMTHATAWLVKNALEHSK